jgi:valyl-tRNA synthetase
MGKRHNLEFINIFNDDASTNENVPEEFRILDDLKQEKELLEKLEEEGFLKS